MASSWIVKRGEKQAGPYTSPQLRSLAKSGRLRPTDLVTRQGSRRFVPAEEVKGLAFPASASDDEELEYGLVEIIDDEEPVLVLEAEEEAGAEANIVDYDYESDLDEKPKSPVRQPRSRNHESALLPAGPRTTRSRRGSSLERPGKKRKLAKAPSDDDEEPGPWSWLVCGIFFVVLGVTTLMFMDPNLRLEGTGKGYIIALLFNGIMDLGGKWLFTAFCVIVGLGSAGRALSKFLKR